MAQTQAVAHRTSPVLFVMLVVLALIASAVLIAGFWGDDEPANKLTKLQTDVSDLETGPGSPTE